MNKKSLLLSSIFGFAIFIYFFLISVNGSCVYKYICSRLHDDSLAAVFLVFLPLFFLSLITYKMREEVFRTWYKFTRIWVPLTIILTLLAPEYGNALFPVTKGTVSLSMSVLFLIISLVIVLITFSKKRI